MLYYLPLEPYIERYTWFMSCENGWAEDNFNRNSVNFTRIEGERLGNACIDTGVVLDAFGRSYYAMSQIMKLVVLIKERKIKEGDIVYAEDFWHPGIESLFYIRQLSGINFKIGTFLHAQSVDEYDFTVSMKEWIRPIEQGFGKGYDYIFVTSNILKQLCLEGGIGSENNIHVVGLPFNSTVLKLFLNNFDLKNVHKERFVLFSSRFDKEKNPFFFLKLVRECPDISFKLVKPRKHISNDKDVINELDKVLNTCNNLYLVDTSGSKIVYYNLLCSAEVQFNCAYQDWVSWTLLEAITFKCKPLYPIWRDFPVELKGFNDSLYIKDDIEDCKRKLYKLFENPFNEDMDKIRMKHDNSWFIYLKIMRLI